MLFGFAPPKHVKFIEKSDATFNNSEADDTIVGFSFAENVEL